MELDDFNSRLFAARADAQEAMQRAAFQRAQCNLTRLKLERARRALRDSVPGLASDLPSFEPRTVFSLPKTG
ncbi:hypothetical protein GT347_24690 [Xylophilus rhododendri]|uniref:Uncharacterized protein n=1 Tax=Xylophilus rhododendri TaxID=2697032 RepID=A0A857JCH0_9BURK|nr:hypothetical protein [Xylophilus rhododendri]QHJ00904.1 hypothetical protein GT347_24690 [Xylophilus rhododendri]